MNIYVLIAGILSIFIGIAHAGWGEKILLKEINKQEPSKLIKAGVTIVWHQATLQFILMGLLLAIISFFDNPSYLPGLIIFMIIIIIGNMVVFFIISMKMNKDYLIESIPQYILFTILITLLVFGLINS